MLLCVPALCVSGLSSHRWRLAELPSSPGLTVGICQHGDHAPSPAECHFVAHASQLPNQRGCGATGTSAQAEGPSTGTPMPVHPGGERRGHSQGPSGFVLPMDPAADDHCRRLSASEGGRAGQGQWPQLSTPDSYGLSSSDPRVFLQHQSKYPFTDTAA